MVKKKIFIVGIILILLVVVLGVYYFQNKESFSVNAFLIKLTLPLGGESTSVVKITNTEKITQEFNLYFNNLENFASIQDEKFILGPKESKEIKLFFKDSQNKVDIHTGQLIIETSELKKELPIIIGIEDANSVLAIVYEDILKYENVYPGGKFGVGIKVLEFTNSESSAISAKYYIKNFNDEIILSDEGDLVFGGSMSEVIELPKNIPYGDYIFITSIDYKGIRNTASYLFSVSGKKYNIFPENSKFFIFAILIFVGAILVLFFYFMKTRDDLLVQLKRQQSKELRRNLELVNNIKKGIKKSKSKKKNKQVKQLIKVKKKIIKKIKIKQRTQRKELRKLKKQGKKESMKRKLKSWENQGYKMFETKREMSKISPKNISNQIKKLEKQGYRI